MNAVKLKISRLVVAVNDAITGDVHVADKINRCANPGLNGDLTGSGNRNVSRDINLDVSFAPVGIAGQGERLVAVDRNGAELITRIGRALGRAGSQDRCIRNGGRRRIDRSDPVAAAVDAGQWLPTRARAVW